VSEVLLGLGLVLLAYLAGSLSPSVILGRALKGIDLREHGSGNPGTTNAFRVLGTWLGLLVFAADLLKGFLPVLLARYVAGPWVTVLVAMAAILGHNWSLFLRGRGGKGVATGAGVILAMMPLTLVLLLAVFFAVFAATRFVSLASITATALFPVLAVAFDQPQAYLAFSMAGSALVIAAHHANIRRLLRGEERRAVLPGRIRRGHRRGQAHPEESRPPGQPRGSAPGMAADRPLNHGEGKSQ